VETNEPILEYDFEAALRSSLHGESKSLSPEGKEIQCSGCGAVSLVTEQSTRCSFCGSPVVVDLKESVDRIIPESILPFSIDKKTAQTSFLGWLKSRWFAPGDLSKRANREGMDGVYLPYWTYDADTSRSYKGERGVYYLNRKVIKQQMERHKPVRFRKRGGTKLREE